MYILKIKGTILSSIRYILCFYFYKNIICILYYKNKGLKFFIQFLLNQLTEIYFQHIVFISLFYDIYMYLNFYFDNSSIT